MVMFSLMVNGIQHKESAPIGLTIKNMTSRWNNVSIDFTN